MASEIRIIFGQGDMHEGSGNKSPKTLADVSHLFFSSTEERPPAARAGGERRASGRGGETRVFVVTGSEETPGKSTIAVNLAHALLSHGRVGLFDADPSIPNARFFLGLPSWNYLSPITGDGVPAATHVTDCGLVVVDWSIPPPVGGRTLPRSVSVSVPGKGAHALDLAVVDAPLGEAAALAASAAVSVIVIGEPGAVGFERTFESLGRLARDAGVREAGLVVNRVPSLSYARSYCAKTKLAASRLLSMDVRFLGGLIREVNLGAAQRERGVLVTSRPDAAAALLLKEVTANALDLAGAKAVTAGGPERPA